MANDAGGNNDPSKGQRDLYTQLIISCSLGLSAFVSFCALRLRWKSLYAARKKQANIAASLPELPDSFLGWIPALYKISDTQVLRSAGLDALVFLSLFRLATKFLSVALCSVLIIMIPIEYHFKTDRPTSPGPGGNGTVLFDLYASLRPGWTSAADAVGFEEPEEPPKNYPVGYFWMHVTFVYLFTGLVFYFLNDETKKIIKIRQEYLGSQSTVTDRTLRLSGIPTPLQSEETLKEFIEKLEIGKVESITICRDWSELDTLMSERADTLRRLEESWAAYLKRCEEEGLSPSARSLPRENEHHGFDGENSPLLGAEEVEHPATADDGKRPSTRIRYGFLYLQSKKVDAIDYYEEKLRRLDEKIKAVREKDFKPMPLAFVTMDSIAACQMAVQAILDPSPLRLIAQVAPAPSDIVWSNTYLPRKNRMARAWSITLFVGILTVVWSILLVPLAALLDIKWIQKYLPGLGVVLDNNKVLKSLIQTGLPTLVVTLLNVAVPYLYDWLSNWQGMISQGEVELSVISKNFFFTFFNLFLLYTVLGSAWNLIPKLRDSLSDSTDVAINLAKQLEVFGQFYINLIILQGFGLLPLRLLEFGSLAYYPITRMGAKTPRDYAELAQPPVFKYGFYLPQTLLIFIICIVYSVLPHGVYILFFGLAYFIIGYFTYKYQLLYAMDHNQHSTGRVWPIISYRTILGVGVFHVAMAGWLAFRQAFTPAATIVPLLPATVWFSYYYARTYEPLTKFIALSSIRRNSRGQHDPASGRPLFSIEGYDPWRQEDENIATATVDEEREKGLTFTNPNLTAPLEEAWIADKVPRNRANGSRGEEQAQADEQV